MIKVFLKYFEKLTKSHICWRLFSDEVENWRLKLVSGAGALL